MKRVRFAILYFGWLMTVYFVIRVIFYFLYFNKAIPATEVLKAFYWGSRIDFSVLFLFNLPYLLYYFFAGYFFTARIFNFISYVFLWGMNMAMLAINIIDLAYFRYNNRRSNIDILYVTADSFKAKFFFLHTYWPLLLLFITIVVISLWLMRTCILPLPSVKNTVTYKKYFFSVIAVLLLSVWLATGDGFRPLMPSAPLLYIKPELLPLADNSTITFLYSLVRKQTALATPAYFTKKQLDNLFTVRRQYAQLQDFRKQNVVIFILESFSAELLNKDSSKKAKTPFLDSLRGISIDCENAFSNALESNKGIVALLGSIPPLMDEPYYYSSYSTNPFRGLGTILKESGYSTNFFMGASPDHFGFGKWNRMLGIDHYYSEKEYNNPAHHDGNWGIYDHYFLPYAAEVLKAAPSPFLAVLFNISSHPPFTIPAALKNQFTIPGQDAQQNSISYVDYSLRLFFNAIKNEPWYDSTLFVFSADHPIAQRRAVKSDLYNYFRIPVFFHVPSGKQASVVSKPVQQLDIVPTILDMLCYNQPFMSFGNSILRNGEGYAVNKVFDNIQMIDSCFVTGYNQGMDSVVYFYNYKKDPELESNLVQSGIKLPELDSRKQKLKAFIQRFDGSLRNNQLLIK